MKNLYLLFSVLLFTSSVNAQGNLLVFPKRVVFEGAKRTADLNLSNYGEDTARYMISLVQIRMTKDGKFETITQPDSGQHFADKNIRFFPRSVVLAPNETQDIKIQLINTGNLQEGEYRSHLYFRAESEPTPAGLANSNETSTSISVNLVPIFGITIPVIIKVGESDTKTSVAEYKIYKKDSLTSLEILVNRYGNMSVYGDITVQHISPTGHATIVNNIQGVAVYAPTAGRKFTLTLQDKEGVDYTQGMLRLSYKEQGQKGAVLLEKVIPLSVNSIASSK